MIRDKIPTARELIEFAARMGTLMFAKDGELAPLWHVVLANGEHGVIAPDAMGNSTDKDVMSEVMRRLIKEMDVVAYVFMAESWMRLAKEPFAPNLVKVDLGEDPQRQECLWYSAEDITGAVTAYQMIERLDGQKPRLGPLKWTDEGSRLEGRFIGLLPVKGRMH